MVIVKIEIWPKGNEKKAKTIGVVAISNNGKGSITHGDYDIRVAHGGKYFGKPGA